MHTSKKYIHVIVKKKGKECSLSKHCSRNVLKRQILTDSIIPRSRSESRKCVSNHEVSVCVRCDFFPWFSISTYVEINADISRKMIYLLVGPHTRDISHSNSRNTYVS